MPAYANLNMAVNFSLNYIYLQKAEIILSFEAVNFKILPRDREITKKKH